MLALGFFLFALTFAGDMISELQSIDKRAKTKKSKPHILKQLNEIISIHSDVKE